MFRHEAKVKALQGSRALSAPSGPQLQFTPIKAPSSRQQAPHSASSNSSDESAGSTAGALAAKALAALDGAHEPGPLLQARAHSDMPAHLSPSKHIHSNANSADLRPRTFNARASPVHARATNQTQKDGSAERHASATSNGLLTHTPTGAHSPAACRAVANSHEQAGSASTRRQLCKATLAALDDSASPVSSQRSFLGALDLEGGGLLAMPQHLPPLQQGASSPSRHGMMQQQLEEAARPNVGVAPQADAAPRRQRRRRTSAGAAAAPPVDASTSSASIAMSSWPRWRDSPTAKRDGTFVSSADTSHSQDAGGYLWHCSPAGAPAPAAAVDAHSMGLQPVPRAKRHSGGAGQQVLV